MNQVSDPVSDDSSETVASRAGEEATARITDLLDWEIEHVRSEGERSGWTRWALLGAIASVIWLTLDIVERASFEPINIGLLFVAFALFTQVLTSLGLLLESRDSDSRTGARFWLTDRLFGASRARLLLELVHLLVVIIIASLMAGHVTLLFRVVAYLTCGSGALGLAIIFILSYSPFPLATQAAKATRVRILYLAILVGSLVPAIGYFWSAISLPPAVGVDGFRLAVLSAVLSYLLRTLAGLESRSPLLGSLVAIRCQVAFGRMDIDTAVQQTDIALTGLRVSDVLQREIRDVLERFTAFGTEMQEASKKLEAMRVPIESAARSKEESRERELSVTQLLIKSIGSHLTKAHGILQDIDRPLESFRRRAAMVVGMSGEAKPAVSEVADQLRLAAQNTKRQTEKFAEQYESLVSHAEEVLGVTLAEDDGMKED